MAVIIPTTAAGKKLGTFCLTIDGKKIEVPPGATVLEAARGAGIYIPTLCYDPDLKPYGACCLCVVEVKGMRGSKFKKYCIFVPVFDVFLIENYN